MSKNKRNKQWCVIKKWSQMHSKISKNDVNGKYCIYTNCKIPIFVKSWNTISNTYSIPKISTDKSIYSHLWENFEDVQKFANDFSIKENVAVMVCQVVDVFGWH